MKTMFMLRPGSFLETLRDAWRDRAALNDRHRSREELAFLPAALEIQHTPPHPLPRWLGLSLVALFLIAVLWACFGHINIVAVAEGRIIPSGHTKTVQPLEKGIVTAIRVKDGEFVEKQQPLIELDRSLTQADQQRLTDELHTTRLMLARHKALQQRLQGADTAQAPVPIAFPPETQATDRQLQEELLASEWHTVRSRESALQSQVLSRSSERDANRALIRKLEGTLPLVQRRTEALKSLLDKKLGSEAQYLELEAQRITQQQDLAAARSRDAQLNAGLEEARQQLNAQRADTLTQTLNAIHEQERRIRSLSEELGKATDLNARQILYAPVAGQVQQLAVHTVGGVVTEAQVLMHIVPREEYLEVEAWLPNKDIGFVEQGAEAEIKVHTFPYTRYGVLDAVVTRVAADAVNDEKRGLIYGLHLRLARDSMQVDGRSVRLIPGMTVTAEIKTGERRLIEYFLSPLIQHASESVRER